MCFRDHLRARHKVTDFRIVVIANRIWSTNITDIIFMYLKLLTN
jgi:hypothetical protein